MTRTMGDPIHLAWRLDDRVQLLAVPGHYILPFQCEEFAPSQAGGYGQQH
jgi:hypothetical protein